MRAAIIDMGSNSLRLLLGKYEDGQWKNEPKKLWTTRLGAREADGALTIESQEASYKALREMKDLIDNYRVEKVLGLATSAVREAPNGAAFLAKASEICPMEARCISGEEEARLAFLGATKDVLKSGLHYAVLDVGGGSTEISLGNCDGVYWSVSYPMGAVRYRQISEEGPQRVWEESRSFWDPLPLTGHFGDVIGVGGTITTLAAIDKKLENYTADAVQGHILTREKIEGILMYLRYMTAEERLQVVGLPPQRADIIVSGAEIITSFMDSYSVPQILVSDSDGMEGAQQARLLK